MWIDKYLGKRWTQEQDCGYWFRKIQKEQFGRDVPVICNIPNESAHGFLRQAMRLMRKVEKEAEEMGWSQTDNPKNGDAALLATRVKIHHIGLIVFIDGCLNVIHAPEGGSVMLSNKPNLKQNCLRIEGFFSYGN